MIEEFWGVAITEHLQNLCFIYCRVISCHFSHCEGVELFSLGSVSFLHLSKGMGTGVGCPEDR
jgi:hypothetical protein